MSTKTKKTLVYVAIIASVSVILILLLRFAFGDNTEKTIEKPSETKISTTVKETKEVLPTETAEIESVEKTSETKAESSINFKDQEVVLNDLLNDRIEKYMNYFSKQGIKMEDYVIEKEKEKFIRGVPQKQTRISYQNSKKGFPIDYVDIDNMEYNPVSVQLNFSDSIYSKTGGYNYYLLTLFLTGLPDNFFDVMYETDELKGDLTKEKYMEEVENLKKEIEEIINYKPDPNLLNKELNLPKREQVLDEEYILILDRTYRVSSIEEKNLFDTKLQSQSMSNFFYEKLLIGVTKEELRDLYDTEKVLMTDHYPYMERDRYNKILDITYESLVKDLEIDLQIR